jgi:hypothetical protein
MGVGVTQPCQAVDAGAEEGRSLPRASRHRSHPVGDGLFFRLNGCETKR